MKNYTLLPGWRMFALWCVGAGLMACQNPAQPTQTTASSPSWTTTFRQQLTLMGHRNWIVVADAAYPLQNAHGIQTLDTDTDQLTVLNEVLTQLKASRHVRPILYVDREFAFLPPGNVPNLAAYRQQRQAALAGFPMQTVPHDSVFGRLDRASRTFGVLILKTTATIPYATVFMELDCAYWNADSERILRAKMK